MRRQPSRLHRALAVGVLATGSLVVACNLELTGLADVPLDASVPTTTSSASPDAAAQSTGAGSGGIGPTSGPTGSQADDASTGASSEGGPASTPPIADASRPDAPSSTSAPPPPDGAAPAPDASVEVDCDQDGDGFRSTTDDCGGTDCCDRDARAFPGETSFFAVADACGSFDYDCNGQNELEFTKVDCTISGLSCVGNGFDATPPACGVTGTFDTCHIAFLSCSTTQDQEAQACR